jgi:hypothetical protein
MVEASDYFRFSIMPGGAGKEQEFELSKYAGRVTNKVLRIIMQTEQDFDSVPYLGLMVEIARFCEEYTIHSLIPWFSYWLDEHDMKDRYKGEKFGQDDVGHYLCVAESTGDDSRIHHAEMLARTRLTPGFDEEWRQDDILCKEKSKIGKKDNLWCCSSFMLIPF